jgi:Domain of unknown function (DUF3885)
MDDVIAKVQSIFGVPAFPDAMFYQFDAALRFELGGEVFAVQKRPIKRFLRAVTRAVAVAEAVFLTSGPLTLLVSHYDRKKPTAAKFRGIEASGLTRRDFTLLASAPQNDAEHLAPFGEDVFRHQFVYKGDARGVLTDVLWLALAKEMPISPDMRWLSVYFIDFERGICLHPYDDRGMDLVAMDTALLAPIYNAFGNWLLPYDRERMDTAFSAP